MDTLSLLKASLCALDPTFFRNALRESYKKAAIPGLMDVQVPQEAVYQSELERILRTWLPSSVAVTPQSNAGGRKRSDIIIVPSENHKILLELVATAPAANINEHFVSVTFCYCCPFQKYALTFFFRRASEYGQYLGIKDVWVVHFTLKKNSDGFRYPFPDPLLGVNVLHVWHNFEFDEVIVKTAEKEERITLLSAAR